MRTHCVNYAMKRVKKTMLDARAQYKKYNSFLLIGGSWSIVGFIFGTLYRGDGIFDNTLLALGLIFLLIGGIGIIAEYFKRQ